MTSFFSFFTGTLLREQANGTLESKIPVTTLSEDEEETQEQISTAIHV